MEHREAVESAADHMPDIAAEVCEAQAPAEATDSAPTDPAAFDPAPPTEESPHRQADASKVQPMRALQQTGVPKMAPDKQLGVSPAAEGQPSPEIEVKVAPPPEIHVLPEVAAAVGACVRPAEQASAQPEVHDDLPTSVSVSEEPPERDETPAQDSGKPEETAERAEPSEAHPNSEKDTPKPPDTHQETETPADSVEARESLREGPPMQFFYNYHSYEAGHTVGRLIADSDCTVVAIESPEAANDQQRQKSEDLHNYITSPQGMEEVVHGSTPRASEAFDFLTHTNPARASVLMELGGSGKQVALIDINKDHPEYYKMEVATTVSNAVTAAHLRLEPNENIRRAIAHKAYTQAASNEAREQAMESQLRDLAQQHPGEKIAVVLGSAHLGVQERIERDIPTESVRVNLEGAVTQQKLSQMIRLTREVQLTGTFGRSTLERATLESILELVIFNSKDVKISTTRINAYIDTLSDVAVADHLTQVDRIKAGVPPLSPSDPIINLAGLKINESVMNGLAKIGDFALARLQVS